ncbi:MAG: hypothetical protein QOG09_374 [Solirubrobacterales bacterium]|nr:hypothetical protein [Solirubrobacterales bacterium]
MAGSAAKTIVELPQLSLKHGEGRRLELPLPGDSLSLGGQDYRAVEDTPARLEVSRTARGYALRLSFQAAVRGPCVRCLGPAALDVDVEAREVEEPEVADEELRSPYVEEGHLDLGRWAHDSLVLALPQKLLCRPDCAGLCPVCGESLNDADPAQHAHQAERDSRWAKLDELRLE